MPFTDEQRQKAVEARRRNAEARKAAASTATLERPPVTTMDEDEQPDSENVMAQLASLFQQASSQRAGREKAVAEALDVLGKLDPFKYPEIADNELVQSFVEKVQRQRAQSMDVPPGTIIGTGLAAFKKPWTKNDLLKGKGLPVEEARAKGLIEWVMFTPPTKMDVIWQGIRIIWEADVEGYFPKSHVDTYLNSRRSDRWNERHAAWLFNNPGIPFEPDFQNINAAHLKAMDESNGEYYKPGAGLIALAPSPDLLEAAPATEET